MLCALRFINTGWSALHWLRCTMKCTVHSHQEHCHMHGATSRLVWMNLYSNNSCIAILTRIRTIRWETTKDLLFTGSFCRPMCAAYVSQLHKCAWSSDWLTEYLARRGFRWGCWVDDGRCWKTGSKDRVPDGNIDEQSSSSAMFTSNYSACRWTQKLDEIIARV